jgi:hypothetical protein
MRELTWIPVRILRIPRLDFFENFLPVQQKSERTKSSNIKYSRPMTAIKAPPDKLRIVRHCVGHGTSQNVH